MLRARKFVWHVSRVRHMRHVFGRPGSVTERTYIPPTTRSETYLVGAAADDDRFRPRCGTENRTKPVRPPLPFSLAAYPQSSAPSHTYSSSDTSECILHFTFTAFAAATSIV
uniref:Uncharacterized protein n=1 Tax=Sipha flava TaxID=143950 RepID=A0A2S2QBF6_9HEMI